MSLDWTSLRMHNLDIREGAKIIKIIRIVFFSRLLHFLEHLISTMFSSVHYDDIIIAITIPKNRVKSMNGGVHIRGLSRCK